MDGSWWWYKWVVLCGWLCDNPCLLSMTLCAQVLILAGFQMYLFGALVAFLPVAWLFPHIKLVGRLDISWAYRPGPNRIDNIVSLVNYLLVVPGVSPSPH